VHERHVRVGARDADGLVEVLEGVKADEVVAISGLGKLEDGAAVNIRKGES
jgi:hypothetical protein